MPRVIALLGFALSLFVSAPSWGAPPAAPRNPRAYAVVIGSNPGGHGQERLLFAEADAKRVRDVLTELGRYAPENVKLLAQPRAADILSTLADLRGRLEAHRVRGEDATLFFYYSGHARASAMNLGEDPLTLADLRSTLESLPTALTIVVLDACQSGAFSRVKGAAPAADFSFNSVASLNTRGLAVMASSSSAELSQESDRLGSSFFTHYLLVGLRGAGDQNHDGRVSLDEAYRYAYGQTLAATSRTAVGGQHVTLETELTGQGDVSMTFPASSTSQLVLPPDFEGRVLLQNEPQHAVVAELTKAKGAPLRLAVPPSAYSAIVRTGRSVLECKLSIADGSVATLDPSGCQPASEEGGQAKGAGVVSTDPWGGGARLDPGAETPDYHSRWTRRREGIVLEGAFGFAFDAKNNLYVQQLQMFGYQQRSATPLRWMLGASYRVIPQLAVVLRGQLLESRSYSRGASSANELDFDFSAYGLGLGVRGNLDFAGDAATLYGQVEAGPALGHSLLESVSSSDIVANNMVSSSENRLGFRGSVLAGVQLMLGRSADLFTEVGYAYAPVIPNLIGATHDSGGVTWLLGVRVRPWSKL